jgi:hypothetical protein
VSHAGIFRVAHTPRALRAGEESGAVVQYSRLYLFRGFTSTLEIHEYAGDSRVRLRAGPLAGLRTHAVAAGVAGLLGCCSLARAARLLVSNALVSSHKLRRLVLALAGGDTGLIGPPPTPCGQKA